MRSGTFVGSLTFKTVDGQYVWYSVEVRASEPPEVGSISVEAQVRIQILTLNPNPNPQLWRRGLGAGANAREREAVR